MTSAVDMATRPVPAVESLYRLHGMRMQLIATERSSVVCSLCAADIGV